MEDKKIDEKKAEELKKIYNPYIDKRKEKMNSTKFKVEDVFGDIISKNSVSPEQITKPNNLWAIKMGRLTQKSSLTFLNLKRKGNLIINHLFLPNINFDS